MRGDIKDEYFEWLYDLVCGERFHNSISYRKLLSRLHATEFRYSILKDRNRAEDGKDLRYRFAWLNQCDDSKLTGPCSVLEMMIALSIRCEENIMDDPRMGDRTSQWFWGMVNNLGLGAMMDSRYNERFVDNAVTRLLDREYEPDGEGGLFTIKNCEYDMRTAEIWYQLCWYLDTIT